MKDIVKCIENLRVQFDRHRKDGLKEYHNNEASEIVDRHLRVKV